MKPSKSILIRCDATSQIGFGHLFRCLALADELREAHQCQVAFSIREGADALELVQEKGYSIFAASEPELDYSARLCESVRRFGADWLVLDVRDDLPCSTLERLRGSGVMIATLDDPTERRLNADLAFYPPTPQVEEMDWSGFSGRRYAGWEWVVLRRAFQRPPKRTRENVPLRLLVTMGGSDPLRLTFRAIGALQRIQSPLQVELVVGRGFQALKELTSILQGFRHPFSLHRDVREMAELMGAADLAVACFGVTAYELAAMRVPSVFVALDVEGAEHGHRVFGAAGMAICLGEYRKVSAEQMTEAIEALLARPEIRAGMRDQAAQKIDGRGASRIAALLAGA